MSPQFIDRSLAKALVLPEGLDRYVDSDLVAELEAVHDGPGGACDADSHIFDVVLVDTGRQSRAGDPHEADRRELHSRNASPSINGQPYFSRVLSTHPVKAESRQEADDALRNSLGYLCQGVVLGRLLSRNGVKAPAHAGQLTCIHEPTDVLGMNAGGGCLREAEQPFLSRKFENGELFLGFHDV